VVTFSFSVHTITEAKQYAGLSRADPGLELGLEPGRWIFQARPGVAPPLVGERPAQYKATSHHQSGSRRPSPICQTILMRSKTQLLPVDIHVSNQLDHKTDQWLSKVGRNAAELSSWLPDLQFRFHSIYNG